MNKRFLVAFAVLLLPLLSNSNVYSAETNAAAAIGTASTEEKSKPDPVMADLEGLVAKINTKIQQDKNTEADLAENLKEFDTIVAKHKDADPEELAQVLGMKARLYMAVLKDPAKASEVFKQIKKDYPSTNIGANADQVIAMIQGMIEKKQISDALAPGAPFPDFNETDVEGHPLSLSNFKGKVVLVDFWATWCGPCVAKLPEIQAAYDKFHSQGFEIVGLSLDENKARLQSFVKEKKMPWPEFFDGKKWENKMAVKYGVEAIPAGYLLDREGKIILKLGGDEDLDAEIAKALKK